MKKCDTSFPPRALGTWTYRLTRTLRSNRVSNGLDGSLPRAMVSTEDNSVNFTTSALFGCMAFPCATVNLAGCRTPCRHLLVVAGTCGAADPWSGPVVDPKAPSRGRSSVGRSQSAMLSGGSSLGLSVSESGSSLAPLRLPVSPSLVGSTSPSDAGSCNHLLRLGGCHHRPLPLLCVSRRCSRSFFEPYSRPKICSPPLRALLPVTELTPSSGA